MNAPAAELSAEPCESTFIAQVSVSGILFDMDGVLVRSTGGDERCWLRWAERYGLASRFDLKRTHGRRAVDTLREYLSLIDEQAIQQHLQELDQFAAEEHGGVMAYPGVRELLAGLPPYRWAVVTSATKTMMHHRLHGAGLPAPRHGVGGDMVAQGKPHPEGYLRGAALLSRRPSDCLVIEDAPAGIRAGRAAGCAVLAVASSHQPEELREADWIVRSIDQIEAEIDENATLNLRFPALRM